MHRTGLTLSRAQFSRCGTTSCVYLTARRDYSQNRGKSNSAIAAHQHTSKGPARLPTKRQGPSKLETSDKRLEEPSIFAQLFERKPTSNEEPSQQFDLPKAISPARQGKRGEPIVPATHPRLPHGDDTAGTSIFEQLFPGEESTASKDIAHKRRVTRLARRPGENVQDDKNNAAEREYVDDFSSENTISISIRNHFRNWAVEEGILPETAPKIREYGSHSTVLVLSSVSPNLQESDFHRIAPQGQHLEGWSNGLMKVVQVHDPATYQPLGQYFLFFHSKPAALDYRERVNYLHALSKRAMFSGLGKSDKGGLNSPYPEARPEDEEALRAFTLVPPSVDVDLALRLWNSDFVREAWAKSNIRDIFQESGAGPTTECKVVLALSRGGLSQHDLRLAIEEDGKSRNLAWKLRDSSDSIIPIKMLVSGEQEKAQRPRDIERAGASLAAEKEDTSGQKSNEETEKLATERFPRYLLTFANAIESRRFARNWHKRTVHDDVNKWTVEAEATALW